jgi:hypothetical protein
VRRFGFVVLLASLVGALVLVGGIAGAGAAGKTKCWQLVLNGEYVSHIDEAFPVRCYRQAIAHLPQDALIYGQLRQDIARAMQRSVQALEKKGVKVTAVTPLPPEEQPQGQQQQHKKRGFFAWVADKIGPGNANSVPLPLLALAGLALLLVVAAGVSFAARWVAGRR